MTQDTQQKRGFKRKSIEEIINKKMKSWIKSITDEQLQKDIESGYIVTGGAITSMLLGELPNDYDVYFSSPDLARRVAEYYIAPIPAPDNDKTLKPFVKVSDEGRVEIYIKSAGIAAVETDQNEYDYFEASPGTLKAAEYLDAFIKDDKAGKYLPQMITSNAISLTGDVQLIIRFSGEPEEIHQNYDFVHTTNWYTNNGGLVLNENALVSILTKELKYVGSLYPLCSMFRLKKFIKRGWTITAGEMLKIGFDISRLDLTDMKVLQEQLTGVDAAYFSQLIRLIKTSSRELDRAYLIELINRVFDSNEDFDQQSDCDECSEE